MNKYLSLRFNSDVILAILNIGRINSLYTFSEFLLPLIGFNMHKICLFSLTIKNIKYIIV